MARAAVEIIVDVLNLKSGARKKVLGFEAVKIPHHDAMNVSFVAGADEFEQQ